MSRQQGPQRRSNRNQSLRRVDLLLGFLLFTTDDEDILTTHTSFSQPVMMNVLLLRDLSFGTCQWPDTLAFVAEHVIVIIIAI